MTTFTVMTPQGVGDVLWVYQKLAPLCDRLRLRVYDDARSPRAITRRAAPLAHSLPKVESVEYFRHHEYPAELLQSRDLASLLPALSNGEAVYYAVNPWLESGVPIEAIDPDLPVLWDIGVLPTAPAEFPAPEPGFVVVYVSGDSSRHADVCGGVWSPDQWVDFVDAARYDSGTPGWTPIIVVGSTFDYPVSAYVASRLASRGANTFCVQDLSLGELLWVFGRCRAFFGYQSGLNAIAGLVGARQMMIYFTILRDMGDSWVNPALRGSGDFRWTFFDSTPESAAAVARELLLKWVP